MTLLNAIKGMREALEALEHVKLPGMPFSRCPSCLSPNDMSEPHEQNCKLAAALEALRSAEPLERDAELDTVWAILHDGANGWVTNRDDCRRALAALLASGYAQSCRRPECDACRTLDSHLRGDAK